MNRFTISEFAEELGISIPATNKKVKKLINQIQEQSLELTHNDFKLETEIINNYPTGIVYCNDKALGYVKANTKSIKNLMSNNLENEVINQSYKVKNPSLQQNVTNLQDDFLKGLINELIESKNQVNNYAFEAGKVYYLTDNLSQSKQDAEHWKNEYFKVEYQNKELQNKVNNLEKEVNKLKEQLEKKTSFLGIFRK